MTGIAKPPHDLATQVCFLALVSPGLAAMAAFSWRVFRWLAW